MNTDKFFEQAIQDKVSAEGRVIKEVHRREVWFYTFQRTETGSEQSGGENGRPCVIVSNESNNKHSMTVTIIPVTSKEKKPLPTHVYIDIGAVSGTALAEQITTISKERLSRYIGEIDKKTQQALDNAMSVQLDIQKKETPVPAAEKAETQAFVVPSHDDEIMKRLRTAETERDTYKELYSNLLERLIARR